MTAELLAFDPSQLDWARIALLYGVLLVSLVVHEAAHAWAALLGGDPTAYVGGQVTLNPMPHIRREPLGTVLLPLAVLLTSNGSSIMGFAHAPYDPVWAYRHPRRAALMALAGPAANLVLAVVAFAVLKGLVLAGVATPVDRWSPLDMLDPRGSEDPRFLVATIRMASTFLLINALLLILNLVPLPPFDGAGVVEGLVPKTRGLYTLIRGQLPLLLLGLVAAWWVMDRLFFPVLDWVTDSF